MPLGSAVTLPSRHDPLDDLPPESRRCVVDAVAGALDVYSDRAETIVRASLPLLDAIREVGGLVDSWGGAQFCTLVPKTCTVIRAAAH